MPVSAFKSPFHTGRRKLIFSSSVVKLSSSRSVLANAIPIAASARSHRIPPCRVPTGAPARNSGYRISVGLTDERDAKKSRNREACCQAGFFGEVVVHGSCLDAAVWFGASISARFRRDSVIGVTQSIVVGKDPSIARDHSQGMVL